jgi:hypothetical protein
MTGGLLPNHLLDGTWNAVPVSINNIKEMKYASARTTYDRTPPDRKNA